ncbi:120_t:CDS:2 [Diversispora eburnea]|uniref:120_t:CDS:1 n=1 Tax=Diversispora eburnea TaxID=1213867 RepID=A0A9N8Z3W4_9GLOM|nr:120_t:CDS:2 [Diversispora eburnea]
MNWTSSKRGRLKIKVEQQKQREFFNRQRLKKIRTLLKPNSKYSKTLPNINVVRKNCIKKLSSRDSNISTDHESDKKSLSVSLSLKHSKLRKSSMEDYTIKSYHDSEINEMNYSKDKNIEDSWNMISDIEKRKQNLLRDNNWAGINYLSLSKNFINPDKLNKEKPRNSKSIRKYSIQSNVSSSSRNSERQGSVDNTMDNDNEQFTIINSMSPLGGLTTLAPSVSAETLKWNEFLNHSNLSAESINDFDFVQTNQKTSHLNPLDQNDVNDVNIIQETNQSTPSLISKTITTSGFHSIDSIEPKSIIKTSTEWEKKLLLDDESVDSVQPSFNSDYYETTKYNSQQNKINKKIPENQLKDDELELSSQTNVGMQNDSSVNTQGATVYAEDELRLSIDSDYEVIDKNALNRIHNLEIKNANLQLEISLLKQDVKWLMETVNNCDEFTKKIKQFNLQELLKKLEITDIKSFNVNEPYERNEERDGIRCSSMQLEDLNNKKQNNVELISKIEKIHLLTSSTSPLYEDHHSVESEMEFTESPTLRYQTKKHNNWMHSSSGIIDDNTSPCTMNKDTPLMSNNEEYDGLDENNDDPQKYLEFDYEEIKE